MRLALIIAIWRRHDLEKITIERFVEQSKKFDFDIVIAGSEGQESFTIAKGCHYVEVPNFPVSNKHNALLTKAKELNPTGIILMGSDDFVNDQFWKNVSKFTGKEEKIIGLQDLYFFCTINKTLGYFEGYRGGEQSIGAGRYFSRKILDEMDWRLWDDGINKGLDSNCNKNLSKKGFIDSVVSMKKSGSFLLDVKHSHSITKRDIINICKDSDFEIISKHLGKETADKIAAMEVPVLDWDRLPEIVNIYIIRESKHLKQGQFFECEKSTARPIIEKGYAELV